MSVALILFAVFGVWLVISGLFRKPAQAATAAA
jgi:hypothetical protein